MKLIGRVGKKIIKNYTYLNKIKKFNHINGQENKYLRFVFFKLYYLK